MEFRLSLPAIGARSSGGDPDSIGTRAPFRPARPERIGEGSEAEAPLPYRVNVSY